MLKMIYKRSDLQSFQLKGIFRTFYNGKAEKK